MQYLKMILWLLLIAVLSLAGCVSKDIDSGSDFPERRSPAMSFDHVTDFEHLRRDWPPLLTEEMTQC